FFLTSTLGVGRSALSVFFPLRPSATHKRVGNHVPAPCSLPPASCQRAFGGKIVCAATSRGSLSSLHRRSSVRASDLVPVYLPRWFWRLSCWRSSLICDAFE